MNRNAPTDKPRASRAWRMWAVCLCLMTAVMFVWLARAGVITRVAAGATEAPTLALWYLQSGEWRTDMQHLLTCAEYLFLPESDAVSRLEFDLDE